ncbi:MAG: YebC/PmpR family DNA-binding transcriptional regulator [Alphaproteobacteria bacterium]
MAGHSQFKNIMHRKGAQDAKRAKLFSKMGRELTVAAKLGGDDPEMNARLRAALLNARSSNMPRENIERAIKKGVGGEDLADYQEVRYEGYGPGGVAVIVEALTDNRNRTAAEVRSAFQKFGGSLGEVNSVSFLFDRQGFLRYPLSIEAEKIFEISLEAGADDVETTDEGHDVFSSFENFASVRAELEKSLGEPVEGKIAWFPKILAEVQPDALETLEKFLNLLEDNDDVQQVWVNCQFNEA